MKENSAAKHYGPGFLSLLALLFIGLKLTGYITWPWLWVLAPLWGGLALFLVTFVLVLLFALIAAWADSK